MLADKSLQRYLTIWYDIAGSIALPVSERSEMRTIAGHVRDLQRGLTGERARIATGYMDERTALQAYLLYYWPISLYETTAVLSELRARGQLPAIHSVLDIGSGSAPASFAATAFGAERALLADKSARALDAARAIASVGAQRGMCLDVDTEQIDLEAFSPPTGRLFDLIIASHSINELWHDDPNRHEKRRDFVFGILPALRDDGILLIIEPSAHYTSIPLLELRDGVLDAGIPCVGPCPHSLACPMLAREGRPCFSEWAWHAPASIAKLAEGAGLDRNSLKASWVAFRKDAHKGEVRDVARDAAPGAEDSPVAGPVRGRIVSEPMRNKAGRIRYILCDEAGSLITLSAPQGDVAAMRAGFFNLKRGDLIEAEGLDARGEAHFSFGPAARLRVTMRAPRL